MSKNTFFLISLILGFYITQLTAATGEGVSSVGTLNSVPVIQGVVYNSVNTPLEGVTVKLVGYENLAVTNANGEYTIYYKVPSGKGTELEASCFGYFSQKISGIETSEGQTTSGIDFYLTLNPDDGFDLVELSLNPNPQVSTIEEGGTLTRYYQVLGVDSRIPINGAEVEFEKQSNGTVFSYISGTFDGLEGIVQVKLNSQDIGSANTEEQFLLKNINQIVPVSQVSFSANVLPRIYSKKYEIDANLDVSFGLAVGGSAAGNAGIQNAAGMTIIENDNDLSPDKIKLETSTTGTAGVEVGVEAGVKIGAGPVSGGAYAGASAGVYAILEGKGLYGYNYESVSDNEATSKMLMLCQQAMTLAPVPVLSNVVAFLSGLANWNYLEEAESGIGIKGVGSAEASVGISDKRIAGLGISAIAAVEGEVGIMLNQGYNKLLNKGYSRLSFSGSYNAKASAGIGIMTWDSKGQSHDKFKGAQKIIDKSGISYGGSVTSSGAGVYASASGIKRGSIGISYDLNNYPVFDFQSTLGYSDMERTFSFEIGTNTLSQIVKKGALLSLLSISDESQEIHPFPDISPGFIGESLNDVLEDITGKQMSKNLPGIDYSVDSTKTNITGGFNINIDWAIALKIKLKDVGVNWKTSNSANVERGLFYGFNQFPLENYKSIPTISTSPIEAMTKIFNDGFASLSLSDLFESVCFFCNGTREIGEYQIASNGATLNIDPSVLPAGTDSLSCHNWGWYGNSASKRAADISSRQRMISESIREQQENVAGMKYGIGGFYKFTPEEIPLTSPATLKLVYKDEDVADIDEENLAVFYQDSVKSDWQYIGGTVDAENNTVTVAVDTLRLFTIAPIMPGGKFGLNIDIDTLINNGTMTATVTSDLMKLADGSNVGDNALYSIYTENVEVITVDQDSNLDGIQVYSQNSVITFDIRSLTTPGKGAVRVESVYGTSKGYLELEVIDTTATLPPVINKVIAGDGEIALVISNPDTNQVSQFEIYFDNDSGDPYDGLALAGGEESPFIEAVKDTITISLLQNDTTYYFAVKAIDGGGNRSNYSNEVNAQPLDNIPPAKISELDFTLMPDSSFLVRWKAVGDNGNIGQATKYEIKTSNSLPQDTASWWDAATPLNNVTSPKSSGEYDYHLLDRSLGMNYYLGIQVIDDSQNKSVIAIFNVKVNRATREIDIASGWNLISLPVKQDAGSLTEIYPDIVAGPYVYESSQGYKLIDTLDIKQGCWIKTSTNISFNLNGILIEDTLITVGEGWNMIGGNSGNKFVSNIYSIPEGIIESKFWGYDQVSGYYEIDTLKSGIGCWIKTTNGGQLILGTSTEDLAKDKTEQRAGQLQIIDNNNIRKELYFVDEKDVWNYIAPPQMPGKGIDVRFSNNAFAESNSKQVMEINLNNLSYPLELDLSGLEGEFEVVGINTATNYGRLNSTTKIKISNSEDDKIRLSSINIPTQFYLHQNYPNPFNPTTTIEYGLPVKGKIKLLVYNVLGQVVDVLIDNKEIEAGHHKLIWKAVNHASGVYFVNIQTQSFNDVKKMILIK